MCHFLLVILPKCAFPFIDFRRINVLNSAVAPQELAACNTGKKTRKWKSDGVANRTTSTDHKAAGLT